MGKEEEDDKHGGRSGEEASQTQVNLSSRRRIAGAIRWGGSKVETPAAKISLPLGDDDYSARWYRTKHARSAGPRNATSTAAAERAPQGQLRS